ncbi:hypothetical protein JHL17_12250 [Azospirillum sp. YIM B02556]|uniref:Uncharacterized protein n=1 Tax=Azospirillum endophyticum TaxID=2800326 RepID=A0ABS1F473_9PROT|nr:hypothetical protein [Azospirillum endophyticum]MBK1838186.1 hypothetical protein [Azospirillum endophyticum]
MEIRGVSSSTANRPTAFEPAESGTASPSGPAQGAAAQSEKASSPGYTSPFLRYDQGARVAVLYFRDFDTGETQDQIPSQRVVEEYRRTASRLAQDDERKSAAGRAGSLDGGSAGKAASGSGPVGAPARASVGASVASGSGGAAVANTAAPATGGFTPSAPGGSYGGSPGGLVSVTV